MIIMKAEADITKQKQLNWHLQDNRLTHENQLELKLKNVNLKMIYVTYNVKRTKHFL